MSLHISIDSDPAKDKKIAKKSCESLEKILSDHFKGPICLKLKDISVELPISVVNPLLDLLSNISKGKIIESKKEVLTTQQAANLLNVSRPFVVSLIENKELPSFQVGSHRRIYKSDLLQYKEKSLKERRKILQKLVDEAQNLDLGY